MTPQTDYRTIPLTKGLRTIVDAADYDFLNKWEWHATIGPNGGGYYAGRTHTIDGRRRRIGMARIILGLQIGDSRQVDHINRNSLDNRRRNLRIVTQMENSQNRKKPWTNTSGFIGVTYNKGCRKWQGRFRRNYEEFYCGLHDTARLASRAVEKRKALVSAELNAPSS